MDQENLDTDNIPAVVDEAPAVIIDIPAAPAPEPVEVEEPKPVVVEEPKPEPVPVVEPTPVVAKPTANHVVGNGDADDVYLAKCVYKNIYERKSLTIHHLQRRLEELGYNDVVGDKDGWLGELTMMSVEKFQKDKGLAATGKIDADTFRKIFEGDSNVNVVL
jgi:peptidoglycan hydrolase-like protein with peptidoglycan-binding domain